MAKEFTSVTENEDNEVDDTLLDNVDTEELDEEGALGTDETGVAEDNTDTEVLSHYTQEQMESAIKNRVSTFNKKIEKMKPYELAVNKISQITGLSIGDLISRLEGMSDIEQANILGVTPQQLASQRMTDNATKQALNQAQQLQRELEEQKLKADPKYKDFGLYSEEINDILEDNPKLSLRQAYTLAKGELATSAAVRDAEQRAVAKMTKSSNQRVLKPGGSTTKAGPKIDQATISAAKKVGMDPIEYAMYSGISNLDQFESMKKKGK